MRHTSAILLAALTCAPALAQVPPSPDELAAYRGLHAAAARGDNPAIETAVRGGAPVNATDPRERTPLHVAIFQKQHDAARALLRLGADPNRLEFGRYDIITIAAGRKRHRRTENSPRRRRQPARYHVDL